MKELIGFLVKQFISEENFEIMVLEDEETVEYKVLVDQEHIARLIGKNGKTSRAIRTLVRAASRKSDKVPAVTIEER